MCADYLAYWIESALVKVSNLLCALMSWVDDPLFGKAALRKKGQVCCYF